MLASSVECLLMGLSLDVIFGDVAVPVFCSLIFLMCSSLLLGYEFFTDSGSHVGGVGCKHFRGW